MATRLHTFFGCVLLFPCLGVFYFLLLMLGQADFPAIQIGDTTFHELEQLRPFGSPSLSNLMEIPIAALFGLLAAIALLIFRGVGYLDSASGIRRFVGACYGVAVLFYLLMPTLGDDLQIVRAPREPAPEESGKPQEREPIIVGIIHLSPPRVYG